MPRTRDDKFPYFPFYVDDFLDDEKVEIMTTEEVGAYLLLLLRAWKQDPAGSLPPDDTTLARWARLEMDRWDKMKHAVLAPFQRRQDGRYYQLRMVVEYKKIRTLFLAKSRAGKRGAKSRWVNSIDGSVMADPEQCHNRPNAREEEIRLEEKARARACPVEPCEPEATPPRLASPKKNHEPPNSPQPAIEHATDGPAAAPGSPTANETGSGHDNGRAAGQNSLQRQPGGNTAISHFDAVLKAIRDGTGRPPDDELAAVLVRRAAMAGCHPDWLARWIREFCENKRLRGDRPRGTKLLLRVFPEEFPAWWEPKAAALVGSSEMHDKSVETQFACERCGEASTKFGDGELVRCACPQHRPANGGLRQLKPG